jgi:deoxyribodipyrimidine photo-lyase
MEEISIFWFRRDLRLNDNCGLFHGLENNKSVLPLFIFDRAILSRLEDKDDARVSFIHQEIRRLASELNQLGSELRCEYGDPLEVFQNLLKSFKIKAIYTNHDYEPYALSRDQTIADLLKSSGTGFFTFKDQVIFEKSEVTKEDGSPYTVFTPYSKKWKSILRQSDFQSYPTETVFNSFYKAGRQSEIPSLEQMGFIQSPIEFPDRLVETPVLQTYSEKRDFPAIKGTSRLSLHLRFGTISIRYLVRAALENSETWLNELIWREFYQMILWNFPKVVGNSFKPPYDRIEWVNDPKQFQAWCAGKTGYPIVDAGMRELNATGFMHNRVRMIVASFLTKHLLIDWRWGEAYFARKLLDFELASNNGGWQWAAGCGCDAAPYFRVFSPAIQTEKFDKKAEYIRKWVPEFDDPFLYPKPIVEHKFARERAISVYKAAVGKTEV